MEEGLFAYGTLQIPEVMEAVTGKNWSWRNAEAPGFVQYLLKGEIYPAMVPADSAVTTGRLYEGVNADAWWLLDRFEDSVYQRRRIDVLLETGQQVSAYAYVLPVDQAFRLGRQPFHIESFLQSHLKEYLEHCQVFYRMMQGRKS